MFNCSYRPSLCVPILVFAGLVFASCGDSAGKYTALASKIQTGDSAALQTAVTALQSAQNPTERAAAARALRSQANQVEVRDALLAQYKIDDDTVRPAILEALYFKPTKEIFPRMRNTYYSKKSSPQEKIVCLQGFARSDMKAAHKIVNTAIWSRKSKVDYGDTPTEATEDATFDPDTNRYYRWEFKQSPIQDAAIKAAGESRTKSSLSYITGVLKKKRYDTKATRLLALQAVAQYQDEKAMAGVLTSLFPGFTGEYGRSDKDLIAGLLSEVKGKARAPASIHLARMYFGARKSERKEKFLQYLKKLELKSDFAYCKPSVLRVRNLPSIRGKRIGTCKGQQVVAVTNKGKLKQTIDKQTDFWYEIEFSKGKKGWVFGHYLDKLEL